MQSSNNETKVSYGSHSIKKEILDRKYVEERVKTKIGNAKLNLLIKKTKRRSELLKKYGIEKYDLHPGYEFPESIRDMIPQNVPEYITPPGKNYVKQIVRALYYFKQCALIGPSGTGKTHIVYFIAELTELPIWEVNCGLQTSTYDLFGRYIGLGKENWIDGQIITWCRNGGILYLDEANMMKQDIAARLNPILDTRGHIVLTEKDNEVVKRHPYGYVIISMNPFSSEFAGTKPLNAAFRRRMSVWIDFSYLSRSKEISPEEIKLIQKRSGVDEETATRIVRAGAELRRQYQMGDLPYGPSPGDLINWAILVADGNDPLQAAEESIVGTTSDDPEIQESVRRVIKRFFS
ncbi:AAA family ATPase [Candidatus Bathyarchaeota archaeon]|nr:MAG: AAA family ATPase [Candidatus Bathyarchaeota archaeon]